MPKHPLVPAGRYLPLTQAAEKYGMSVATLRRRISDGTLPAYRLGPKLLRVSEADLDAMCRRIPTAGQ